MVWLLFQMKKAEPLPREVQQVEISCQSFAPFAHRAGTVTSLSACPLEEAKAAPSHSRALVVASAHPVRKKQESTGKQSFGKWVFVWGALEVFWFLTHLKLFANLMIWFHLSRCQLPMSETTAPSPLIDIRSSHFAVLEETDWNITLFWEMLLGFFFLNWSLVLEMCFFI